MTKNRRARLGQEVGRVSVPGALREGLDLVLPPDARIRTLRVLVTRPLERGVGGSRVVEEVEEIILLNFLSSGSWNKAVTWAEQSGLEQTDQWEVAGITKSKPKLNRKPGGNPIRVVATKAFFLAGYCGFCEVRFDSSYENRLYLLDSLGGINDWFAFRRPNPKK